MAPELIDEQSIFARLQAELYITRYGEVTLTMQIHEGRIVRWNIKKQIASDRDILNDPQRGDNA